MLGLHYQFSVNFLKKLCKNEITLFSINVTMESFNRNSLIETIMKYLDNNEILCGDFIDLQKVFGNVIHEIFLEQKLRTVEFHKVLL